MQLSQLLDKPINHLITLDWEKALYLTLIILALATRLWGLGIRVQSHDESLHTKYSWNLYAGQGFQHTPLMHGPFLFHATAFSYFLFGANDFTARLPIALIGVALVAFPYLLRRWLGRVGALVTSFLLLISPSIAYYSRYIRHDIPVILWSMIVFFAIFAYLRDRRERWLYWMAAGVSLMFATKEVAFIYNALFGFFLVGLFAYQALRHKWDNEELKSMLGIPLIVLALGLLILSIGILRQGGMMQEEAAGALWRTPWVIGGGILTGGALLAAIGMLLWGVWPNLRDYRSFDLVILLGTLCLPFLSPIPIKVIGLDPIDYTRPTIYYSGAITGVVLLISAAIGLAWDWRRWSIAAAIHYAIFTVLFTTVFTNGTGIASGMVGSMGYWLAQHGVKRGAQPWYYYGILVPMYEYLPLLLTLITALMLVGRGIFHRLFPLPEDAKSTAPWPPYPVPRAAFLIFLFWWVAGAWVIYSYAGEKMPWLVVHLALPMILLSGRAVGRFIEAINWPYVFQKRAWLLALLAPPFFMALVTFFSAIGAGPFQGSSLAQLNTTGRFLGSLAALLALGAGLVYLIQRNGWRISLYVLLLIALLVPVLLTVRTSWRFCYINFDYPIEHLVYAHAGPAVKDTMRQIEELSRRIVGGPKLIKVAYGADGSWPFHWYLRDYPNAVFYGEDPTREQLDAPVVIAGSGEWDKVSPYLSKDYLVNTYTFLWWPVEDYKNLTWERIRGAITDPQMRAALWDIWYNRDYGRYDDLHENKSYALDEWPLRSEYRLYIRRDVAGQMWDQSTVAPQEVIEDTDPYAEAWQEVSARQVFGGQGAEPGQFQNPRGIAVGPDGFVYVADTGNHRIQTFTADGEFVAAWGQHSLVEAEAGQPRGFNEPWDVAVIPALADSSEPGIVVADTWNHRIQILDGDGQPINAWGSFGDFSFDDGSGGQSLFYGPRGVAVGPEGLIYVTDTGNKRVQVFDQEGEFVTQWGGGGVAEGYLDEPVGIAFGSEGEEVYVADTWNRRVQVFNRQGGFLRQWLIDGWNAGIPDEKPYLAVGDAGHIYVTDPGYYRVLAFDDQGDYLLSFGQYGTDEQSFALPQGIAVAEDGSIYVTDAHGHRVLVFDSLQVGQ